MNHGDQRRSSDGIAIVELAICLPIIVLILLATIEACEMLQLQQNVATTAYEGARIGIMPGAEAAKVQLQCKMLLDDRSITNYTISTSPSDLSTASQGDQITVTVDADCVSNSVLGGVFFQGRTINESVVMRAE
ncbi:MAG: TadE/TadG family type IV pilus assembly protein [Rubripirellula sp.]